MVFPLLFLVLFALVEFGWAFKDSLSIGHGAREAARAGATFGNDPFANFLVLQEIEDVVDPVGIADGLRVRVYNPVTGVGDNYVFHERLCLRVRLGPLVPILRRRLLRGPLLEPRELEMSRRRSPIASASV